MDKYFDLERFLSESEKRAYDYARGIYPDNKELAERLARLVRETRQVRAAVVREVQESAAA
jgi:hypothetical protein